MRGFFLEKPALLQIALHENDELLKTWLAGINRIRSISSLWQNGVDQRALQLNNLIKK
jgi:hypothetical protein